ncbi:pyridoxamine 5'-phosphate oxidase family protein [Streptomyces sp. NPDC101062]|uniref:pyridoxamine 5'-phosphate oxidase family protein n=1 Tax=unclassified Streptomyces TaxID=2593676 RepID=UPI002E775509|nr:TIGR03618 family F420-dependent PPOX class oxidoreductase [Streptomyces sp. JV176]MEE1800462.1 TIGR03618 family F420-dependent PPOX class oxidoreductase [Streptomyces sp. JV176]
MASRTLLADPAFLAFWEERHVCLLATRRPDGTPHLVPVGVTYDPEAGIARVITGGATAKARNVIAAGPDAFVAVSQFDGARWATLEGTAVVNRDPEAVAEAERRYTRRYKPPRVNPERVAIEITVTRAMGRV